VKGEPDFPILKPVIDETHNTFLILYNDDEIPVGMDPYDGYVLDEIVDGVNLTLKAEKIPIAMSVDKKGYITVENTEGKHFDLDLRENSMGIYLGFQEQEYKGKNQYVSESPNMFLDKSYFMFIKEISLDTPVCEITPDGTIIQLIDDLTTTSDMKINAVAGKTIRNFTFQYRHDKDKASDLINFYEEPHEISFELFYEPLKQSNQFNQPNHSTRPIKTCKR